MATTEPRAGFRLPWSTDHRSDTDESAAVEADGGATTAMPEPIGARTTSEAEAPSGNREADQQTGPSSPWERTWGSSAAPMTSAAVPVPPTAARAHPVAEAHPAAVAPPVAAPSRRPSKFLADLTRAMQAAAESARAATLEQVHADAKICTERIHTGSADEAAELRRRCDEDVAGIRDWSKAEIARVREETDRRIAGRKENLEFDLEEHAARIERRIEAIQARIADFETEMAGFFDRLLQEEDPSLFAAMASNLPEPPAFDEILEAGGPGAARAEAGAGGGVAVATAPEATATEPGAEATAAEASTTDVTAESHDETMAGAIDAAGPDEPASEAQPADAEAAEPAVIPDTAETGETTTAEAGAAAPADEVTTPDEGALTGAGTESAEEAVTEEAVTEEAETPAEPEAASDPRLAALGLTPDFAEAEAEAAVDAAQSEDAIVELGEESLAARLAGLVPSATGDPIHSTARPAASLHTQVVVVGLVSVASIAGFKRQLGRLPDVQNVGVSSGPDGEFVFTVAHGDEIVLRDVIPTLPGFQARVTGIGDGIVNVSARDPEAEG